LRRISARMTQLPCTKRSEQKARSFCCVLFVFADRGAKFSLSSCFKFAVRSFLAPSLRGLSAKLTGGVSFRTNDTPSVSPAASHLPQRGRQGVKRSLNSSINSNLFRNRNGQYDLVFGFLAFGNGTDATKLNPGQGLVQIVQKGVEIDPGRFGRRLFQ